jgi:hypothetical protein
MASGHREVTNTYLDWQLTVTPLETGAVGSAVRYRFRAVRVGDRLTLNDLTPPCSNWLAAMVEAQKYVRSALQDGLPPTDR